jgi:hypothetical protein
MATTTTADEKPAKPELYLRVVETRDNGYFHIEVSVCTQKYEQRIGYVPYGVDDTYDWGPLGHDKYSDLRIRCQGDDRSQAQSHEQAVYGESVGYHDVYRLELRDCRRMVRTLEKIDRGLARLTETRGAVRRFSEYVGRIGEILKVKGMGHARSAKQRQYNDQQWSWTTLGDGVREIDNRIWQWQRELKEVLEARQAQEQRQLTAGEGGGE